MSLTIRTRVLLFALLSVLLSLSQTSLADYRIGPDDVLQISFWQQPTLNQTVTVRHDGKVTVSIIGEITAAGLTTAELGKKIGDRANYYDPSISQATVIVLAYNSQKVFINGQVSKPGAYAFEELPDVWNLIKEAGGVTNLADLSKVTLIRGTRDAGKIETLNIQALVAESRFDEIPKLYPGDIVEVPVMPGGLQGLGLPKTSQDRRNVVYITGAVARSGLLNIEEGMDVLEAIAMAGGTTPDADLTKVRVVTKHETYSSVMSFDLEEYASTGSPRRYQLSPEDAIVVPYRGGGMFGIGWSIFRDVVAVTASVISTVLLVDQLGKD